MTSRLNPYLSFRESAREAMEFYRSVFGGKLDMNTFAEFGGAPEGTDPNLIMHAQLESDAGYTLMASDTPAGMPEVTNGTVSLSGDDEQLRDYFRKLSDGGAVTMPLAQQPWGDEFGMCTDRYGTNWMVNLTTR